jgi:hypothetical protein
VYRKKKPKASYFLFQNIKRRREKLRPVFFFNLVVHFASSGAHSRVFIHVCDSLAATSTWQLRQRVLFFFFHLGEKSVTKSSRKVIKGRKRWDCHCVSFLALAAAVAVAGATEVV